MKYTLRLRLILGLLTAILIHTSLSAHSDSHQKRFMDDSKNLIDHKLQSDLRSSAQWQQFVSQHGDWWVQFNERNNKPHRAFGAPIPAGISGSPASVASYFMQQHLGAYLPNSIQLEFISAPVSKKYVHANFIQKHLGLEVLWSRATVKMTPDHRVVMFGLDVYDDISLSTTPTLTSSEAIAAASSDLDHPVSQITLTPSLKILPVPSYRKNNYHLVYELSVRTYTGSEETPGEYYTLVDAHSGDVLYRQNRIVNFANSDIQVSGTVHLTHPYNPTTIVNLPYLQVNVGGVDYNTDVNGFINFPNTAPFAATFTLKGPWAQVYTGASGTTFQSFSANMNPGANTVLFDPNSTTQHLSAYYHTNVVHDFMKNKIGTFTGLDFPIEVRVDRTDGTCNAFYDGGLNFYTTAGGCNALSMVADVVYHEYGHGITNVYWSVNGLNFSNGAMGEGYSDIWAISITGDPILGIGFSSTDPTTFVREYDFNNSTVRKVYPQNIVGQVHSDGEIIAGAWWSTSLQLGSLSQMSDLFAESHAGLANGPDGAEGQVYTDILIDALFADDNDANLSNGTPNAAAISQGFALHGISLLSNATLNHTPVATSPAQTGITLNANLSNLQFAWSLAGVKGAYKINNAGAWTPFTMANTGGNNYSTTIPGQPGGTVISYYIGVEDVNGTLSNVQPTGANDANPNIPYYILVDFNKIFTEDFDLFAGSWQDGAAGDNATTGMWEQYIPEQTDVNGTVVQPDYQVTPGGLICYVTGGAAGTGAGSFDVDGGKTTLTSPVFNLTSYTNPTFEYYRWYTNDQGATPGTDFWQVYISNNGTNYIPVENTNVSDHSWRRFVFRVNDYLTPTSTVTVRFVAEDANAGSLIEALMDEFSLYDAQGATGLNETSPFTAVNAWPNPASDALTLSCITTEQEKGAIRIFDASGRNVLSLNVELLPGKNDFRIPTSDLSAGMYHVQVISGKRSGQSKFSVSH